MLGRKGAILKFDKLDGSRLFI